MPTISIRAPSSGWRQATPSAAPVEPWAAAQAPAAAQPVEPGHVPLSAMLDEREKRQAAEKALREFQSHLERQRAEWQAAQPAPTPAEALEAQRYADNLRYSRKFAERQYGADTVASVHDWAFEKCDRDPFFNDQMRASDDPYEAAYQAYQREQVLAKVSPDRLAAFEAWEAAQAQAQAQTPKPVSPTNPAPPPRSLAEVSGSGHAGSPALPVGEGEAFASLFRK